MKKKFNFYTLLTIPSLLEVACLSLAILPPTPEVEEKSIHENIELNKKY